MTDLDCPDTPAATEYAAVHIAWELSKADWKLGVILLGTKQMSRYTIKGAIWPRSGRGSRRRAPRRARAACR